mmetsp:Transcript_106707/g.299840  ORF Transcript_106707/g.299840 Transcript_106707/m.299840 type:complete len:227 (+) Transcript_106707:412-1092(+)
MAEWLSMEPLANEYKISSRATKAGSFLWTKCLSCTKRATSLLVSRSTMPSQITKSRSPWRATSWVTSGRAMTFCSSGPSSGFILYFESPIALDMASSPSVRSCLTKPPARLIRAASREHSGLWSSVNETNVPLARTNIARESPTLTAVTRQIFSLVGAGSCRMNGRTKTNTQVEPWDPNHSLHTDKSRSTTAFLIASSVKAGPSRAMRWCNSLAKCLATLSPEWPS